MEEADLKLVLADLAQLELMTVKTVGDLVGLKRIRDREKIVHTFQAVYKKELERLIERLNGFTIQQSDPPPWWDAAKMDEIITAKIERKRSTRESYWEDHTLQKLPDGTEAPVPIEPFALSDIWTD